MSKQEENEGAGFKLGVSRRKFLKTGTAVVVGVGLGDALARVVHLGDGMVAFAGCQGSIVVDTLLCAGCQSCTLACTLGHTGFEDLSNANIRIIQDSFAPYPDDVDAHVRGRCDLCANTPYWDEQGGAGGKQACVEVCPMRAIQFVPA